MRPSQKNNDVVSSDVRSVVVVQLTRRGSRVAVPGVHVTVRCMGSSWATRKQTDALGEVRFALPVGRYQARLTYGSLRDWSAFLVSGEDTRVDIELN